MIFRALSIFRGARPVQLLKKAATPRGPCALCLRDAGRDRICADCLGRLPRPVFACPRCALSLSASEVCGACLAHPPAIDAALAAFDYRFPVDRLVQRFKFAHDLAIGRWLGERLAAAVADAERPDLLVAPPLARLRLHERGFNQALELARVVAAVHGLPVEIGAVEKVRDTAPQPGLGRSARRANLRDAFRATGRWPRAHVAVVDDVMTTGATVEAMAHVLKRAGARRVSAWVVARTPEPGR